MEKQDGYIYIGNECYSIKNVNGQSEVRRVFPDSYEVVFKGSYGACTSYIQEKYDDEYVYSF